MSNVFTAVEESVGCQQASSGGSLLRFRHFGGGGLYWTGSLSGFYSGDTSVCIQQVPGKLELKPDSLHHKLKFSEQWMHNIWIVAFLCIMVLFYSIRICWSFMMQ